MYPEQVSALVNDGLSIAWLAPTGAARVARGELTSRPFADKDIRIETAMDSLANNNSALVSEFVRTSM
jgi:hypothetical protein